MKGSQGIRRTIFTNVDQIDGRHFRRRQVICICVEGHKVYFVQRV